MTNFINSLKFSIFLSCFLTSSSTLSGNELPEIPMYEVKQTQELIIVDGCLTEKSWRAVKPIVLIFPWKEQPAAHQRTEVRLLWDDESFYIGYICKDTDITAYYDKRDDPVYKDDCVEIFINPNPARSNFYYGCEMSARGVLYDYFYVFGTTLLERFDMQRVQLATNIKGTLNTRADSDQGWTLEVKIPFVNLKALQRELPPKIGSHWRIQLSRWDGVKPNRCLSMWTDSALKKPNPHNPERFGILVFSNEIACGKGATYPSIFR